MLSYYLDNFIHLNIAIYLDITKYLKIVKLILESIKLKKRDKS